MTAPAPRPEWLTEPCPHWCEQRHDQQDHPVDRLHTSPAMSVPVIERARTADDVTGDVAPRAVATEAIVRAAQPVGDGDVWISLATEQHLIELSSESLTRVLAAVDEVRARLVPAF